MITDIVHYIVYDIVPRGDFYLPWISVPISYSISLHDIIPDIVYDIVADIVPDKS